MNDSPSVGIGILNWNGRRFLEQFLPFFDTLTYPDFTVYVIDNNSTDNSIEFLQKNYPAVKFIQTGANLGFAGGYNYGFEQMPEKYLLMVNSDVELTPGFLEPMVRLMEQDELVAACQPKILSYANRTRFEHAGAAGGMMDFWGYAFCRGRLFDKVEEDKGQYNSAPIFWASGACSLIRKTAYAKVGGMYAYYFMHFEEIDLCWRFHTIGFKVMYCADATAYHVGGGSLAYTSPKKTYYNFRNNFIMCLRNSPLSYLVWWVPLRVALDGLAAGVFLLKGEFKNTMAVVKAYRAIIKWLVSEKNKCPLQKMDLRNIPVVYKKSLLWRFYTKKKIA